MSATHTQGPWEAGRGGQINSPTGVICECWSHMGSEEARANENLIAAAPDTFLALVMVIDTIGFQFMEPQIQDMVRAAIDKASPP